MNWSDYKAQKLTDPEFKKIWDEGELEYQLKCAIIEARINNKMTQQELAEKVGTKQSSISRFERGNYKPTWDFLQRLAKALGKELKVSLIEIQL